MIQITPQMRILLAVELADFRKGIDGLAELCRARLETDPLGGALFIFSNRSRCRPPNNAIAHRSRGASVAADRTPLECALPALGPLEIGLVRRMGSEKLFAHLLQEHHYLGNRRPYRHPLVTVTHACRSNTLHEAGQGSIGFKNTCLFRAGAWKSPSGPSGVVAGWA